MSGKHSIERLFSRLGIQGRTDQRHFKNEVRKFLNESLGSKTDAFSAIATADVKMHAIKFVDSREGQACLSKCVTNSVLNGQAQSGLTKNSVADLIRCWSKNKKKNDRKVTISHMKPIRSASDPGSPMASPHLAADVQQSPAIASRIPLSVIDLDDEEVNNDLLDTMDNDSECTTDDLPTASELIDKGKRKEVATAEELWSPDTDVNDDDTDLNITIHPAETVVTEVQAPLTQEHRDGLLSPPDTGRRLVRPREDGNIGESSPAADRRIAKRVGYDPTGGEEPTTSGPSTILTYGVESTGMGSVNKFQRALDVPTSSPAEFDQSLTNADRVPHTSLAGPVYSISICSEEAFFSHENLVRIPATILGYLRRCEQQYLRQGNDPSLGAVGRRMGLEKSRMLRSLQADIESRLRFMSYNDLKQEAKDDLKEDPPVISSYVLWHSSDLTN